MKEFPKYYLKIKLMLYDSTDMSVYENENYRAKSDQGLETEGKEIYLDCSGGFMTVYVYPKSYN